MARIPVLVCGANGQPPLRLRSARPRRTTSLTPIASRLCSPTHGVMLPLRKLGGTGCDWSDNAVYHKADIGPTFGGGFDLHIASNANANARSCHMMGVERGGSYAVPVGVDPNLTPPVLASALHFTVAKLFVFEVVTEGAGVSASTRTAAGVSEGEGEGEGGGTGAQETRGPES